MHDPDEFAEATPPIDGTLEDIEMEVHKWDPQEEYIREMFSAAPNLIAEDAENIIDVEKLVVNVSPTVTAETDSDRQENYIEYLNRADDHLIARENGDWRLVI